MCIRDSFQPAFWQTETILLAVPSAFPVNDDAAAYRLSFDDVRDGRHLDPAFPAVGMERLPLSRSYC